MIDDDNFIAIWVGTRSIGHRLTLKSEAWKLDSFERVSFEIASDLMIRYLSGDLSKLQTIQWNRPIERVLLDNIEKLISLANIR